MLAAGSGSRCDICIEAFGCDGKTPCAIACGHVFCIDCLDRITRPSCPICRSYYDPKGIVKLHLDLDNLQASPNGSSVKIASEDLDAGQDLHQRISKIAEQGSSEGDVRALMSEAKKFLQDKPRGSFKDLRTLHRMVSYLCEVKTDLRARKQAAEALQKEKVALQEEKAELVKKIEEQLLAQKKETQRAVNVEVELREHCAKAHEAYTRMVDQYNYVAKEWMKLNGEVGRLRLLTTSEGVTRASPSSDHHPALELDQGKLDGVAVRSENSIILAPLPQYTNHPNTTVSLFMPLPEEDEEDDEEDEEDEESSEESDPEPSEKHVTDLAMKYTPSKADPSEVSCGAIAHPYSCDCKGLSVFDDSSRQPAAQPVRPSVTKPLKPAIVNVDRPLHTAVTRPRIDVRRARSYSNPSQSSSRTQSSSRSASRSPSPPMRSPPPQTFHAVYTSPLAGDARTVPQSPPSRTADNEGLRSRLQNLLSDGPYVSSSPPKSSTFSAPSRESRPTRERSLSPSRSPSPPTHVRRHSSQAHRSYQSQPQQNADQISRMLASHQPVIPGGIQPPLSTSPNARTSSASEAARALEQSKRDRRLADEEERNRRKIQTERERSQPERDNDRARSTPSSHVVYSGSSTHQSSGAGMHPSGQAPGTALTSRSSFSSGSMTKAAASAYAPSSHQPVSYGSRYPNATNGRMPSPTHTANYAS